MADLWSPPPEALSLDDPALWADDAVLDRLAAALPVLGDDFVPGSSAAGLPAWTDDSAAPDEALPAPGAPAWATLSRAPSGLTSGGQVAVPRPPFGVSDDLPRARRRQSDRSSRRTRRGDGLGLRPVGLLLLFVLVYAASAAGALLLSADQGPGHSVESPDTQRPVVTDGPLTCPMYHVPEGAAATTVPLTGCFFVG